MKAEMSVAGGLRQYWRELRVLGDLGEHRRKWSIEMVGRREKREPGNTAALGLWDKKRKSIQKI